MLSAYWHVDDDVTNDSYPNGGATVPGVNSVGYSRVQVLVLGDTKPFGSTAVNEFRFSWLRSANHFFTPQGGLVPSLTLLGFEGRFDQPGGIGPIAANLEGAPNIGFSNFSIGVPSDTTRQFHNTFQWQDNFTKSIGTHSLKFGGQVHYDQIVDRNFYGENGSLGFYGGETGVDFADFLLGAPDYFIQASSRSSTFGIVNSAHLPRVLQAALKFLF